MPLFDFFYKNAYAHRTKKVLPLFVLVFCSVLQLLGQSSKQRWVDSVFQTLDFESKIGQLIMIPANSYADTDEQERVEELIKEFNIGGIVFTQGGPVTQHRLTNRFQSLTRTPLLIGLNAEEGLGSTLDSSLVYPPTIMLGAIRSDSMVYHFGKEVGRQMKELGVHISFAPTADLSSIFQSEELINHTFGENPERVAKASVLYMKGLQQSGIIPVAKHYPNYGLKVEGYSKGSPVMRIVNDDKTSLISLKQLIDNGCPAILSSYKHDPIFPDRKKRIASKKKIIPTALPTLYTADFLKREFNFKGLVFSYVPDVKDILRKYQAGDSEIYAFMAGNDILLFPENISATVRKLRRQVRKNATLKTQLDLRVKSVLSFKYDVGLHNTPNTPTPDNLLARINNIDSKLLQNALYEQAITVVRNDLNTLPVMTLEDMSFASLSIGEGKQNEFSKHLSKYAKFDHYELSQTGEGTTQLIDELKKYKYVIAGVFSGEEKIQDEYSKLLSVLAQHTQLIICNLGPTSRISLFDSCLTIIQGYVDDTFTRRIIPQIIFGGLSAQGSLPLTINSKMREGQGVNLVSLGRLAYSFPEAAGISSRRLVGIDKIVSEAIDGESTPGCQVLVIKNGRVVYDKSFGWQTYSKDVSVNEETLYDLASMSKVLGTLQAILFLYDKGMIDIHKKVSEYLPELKSTNKKDITIKDVLTHQAGLQPFIPLWPQTLKDGKTFLPQYYSTTYSNNYPFQVGENLYGSQTLKDSLWRWTFDSKLLDKPARTPYSLRYSDIGFWILHRLAERLLNQPLDEFLAQNLYDPVGARSTGYVPLSRFNKELIAPTEFDQSFRQRMVIGTVHDERAAMMGGVAGHAGLFSNAHDVGKLGQMLLQKGQYGGYQYYKPETVTLFTTKQFETSRRGLGWDRPVESDWASPTSLYASSKTFGHTGFTGTCIWIDPEFELVYVFLSNRVFPNRNSKLISTNIRSRIQDVIYESIFDYSQYKTPTFWTGLK